jgi:hypothetical protein
MLAYPSYSGVEIIILSGQLQSRMREALRHHRNSMSECKMCGGTGWNGGFKCTMCDKTKRLVREGETSEILPASPRLLKSAGWIVMEPFGIQDRLAN